ncbi:MAG: hypothetical protein FWE88_08845 [Phycisphaerae bacterium]|nr:hypothetical protein [Phycisphaerae bacterium]
MSHDEFFEEPLPPELAAMERALRSGPSPADALRDRILAGVGRELAAAKRRQFWRYVAGVAAVMLFAINLSVSAASTTTSRRPGMDSVRQAVLREEIERLQLDIPTDDLVRHGVLLLAAGDELIPMGVPRRGVGMP